MSLNSNESRIHAIDLLRGIAVLGILIMNIQSFSMPSAAYTNPLAYGDMSGINKYIWIFSHLFADQKFMAIFSMLFGASMLLILEKASQKNQNAKNIHFRRNFILLIIGLVHAHLFWYGDILFSYALSAFLLYFFRDLSPKNLMLCGFSFLMIPLLLNLWLAYTLPTWPKEIMMEMKADWLPSDSSLNDEIKAMKGNLSEQITFNSAIASVMETLVFLIYFFWRSIGMMLLGMALYKWGILTAKRSIKYYLMSGVATLLLGCSLVIVGIQYNFSNDWALETSMFQGSLYNYIGSILISYSYVCFVMIFSLSNSFKAIKQNLIAVGRTAFTNYIAQTIICVFIFHGIGLGWFGALERVHQFLIVLMIWFLQILISRLWLSYFYQGPMEWLWRSLTYGKIQLFFRDKKLSA